MYLHVLQEYQEVTGRDPINVVDICMCVADD